MAKPSDSPRASLATSTTTESSEIKAPMLAWASVRLDDEVLLEAPKPIGVEIAAIGVNASIVALGVMLDTRQMEVPENVDEVGWYRHGPSPGRPGSSVLAAHVDIAGEGPGVFFHLDRLTAGDRIEVVFDDGTSMTFVATASERVPKGSLDLDSIFASDGQPLLRLVTCGGGFNRTIRSYDDNIVVTAQPVTP
jgi:hypothetical protein